MTVPMAARAAPTRSRAASAERATAAADDERAAVRRDLAEERAGQFHLPAAHESVDAQDLAGADEVARPEHGAARRYRDVLRDHVKCLALYPLDQPMGRAGAEAFVQEILNDKFNHGRRHEHMTIEDVDDAPRFVTNKYSGKPEEKPSQLEQLVMTVAQRLNGKSGFRAKAGHSMHDMLTSAGLPCACKACCQGRVRVVRAPVAAPAAASPVPVLEIEPENCPF